jgi:hypothetical protein
MKTLNAFYSHSSTVPVGLGPVIIGVLGYAQLHTPQSVGLLWTRDRPVTETFTLHHTTLNSERHP